MKKVRKATIIHCPHDRNPKCPIYQNDDGKFYVKCNSRVSVCHPAFIDGVSYAKVKNIPDRNGNEWWYLGH